MLDKKPSQDFHFKFEHHWGGVPTEVQQFEAWSKKQKGILRWILLNFALPWYAKWWLEWKVDKTMYDVDQQIDQWNEKEKTEPIVERKPSEVRGLDDFSISSYPPPEQWYTGPLEVFTSSESTPQETQETTKPTLPDEET